MNTAANDYFADVHRLLELRMDLFQSGVCATAEDAFHAALSQMFPCRPGGVGFAHRRMKAETIKRLREFWAPDDYYPEPKGAVR